MRIVTHQRKWQCSKRPQVFPPSQQPNPFCAWYWLDEGGVSFLQRCHSNPACGDIWQLFWNWHQLVLLFQRPYNADPLRHFFWFLSEGPGRPEWDFVSLPYLVNFTITLLAGERGIERFSDILRWLSPPSCWPKIWPPWNLDRSNAPLVRGMLD